MICQECGSTFRARNQYPLCSLECPAGCWNWTAATTHDGYGLMGRNRKMDLAHRISYEMVVGSIPKGLQLDHLCRNRACVNPDHLEVVTNRENQMRGMAPSMITNRTGVCQRGHSMEDAVPSRGGKTCVQCKRDRERRYYQERTNA